MAPFLLRDRFQAAALSRKRFKSKAKHVIIIFSVTPAVFFVTILLYYILIYISFITNMEWFVYNYYCDQGRNRMKSMQERFKRLKSEMEEISEEQKNIREGQRQVKEKFELIELECEELKRETRLIIQQSSRTQIKLTLMFRILKAREASEFNIAAQLTEVLRLVSLLFIQYCSYYLNVGLYLLILYGYWSILYRR